MTVLSKDEEKEKFSERRKRDLQLRLVKKTNQRQNKNRERYKSEKRHSAGYWKDYAARVGEYGDEDA